MIFFILLQPSKLDKAEHNYKPDGSCSLTICEVPKPWSSKGAVNTTRVAGTHVERVQPQSCSLKGQDLKPRTSGENDFNF